jgi:hypothetical protein
LPSPCNAVALTNFSMKKILPFVTLLFVLSMKARAQEDPQLLERLDLVLKVTQQKDLEKILDFTYPKLYSIVKREQMREGLQNMFETDEFVTNLDSVLIAKVHPVFVVGEGMYAKVSHSMVMHMKFKEQLTEDKIEEVMEGMKEAYGENKVRFDKGKNTVSVSMLSVMLAIKDSFAKEWCFVNYNEDSPLASMLFSKEVMEKVKEYK